MSKDLPVRKHPRLKGYDYSTNGVYFITLCVKDKHELLGRVIVGRGILYALPSDAQLNVGRGTPDAPSIELSEYGKNVVDTINFLNSKNDKIIIIKYVVMPNHVHFVVVINDPSDGALGHEEDGASGKPRPTNALIPKLISSIKRFTNKQAGFTIWQDSYYDHIIRDEKDYRRIWQYIDENPARWTEDDYYIKEKP